jgi:hypothetical protein
MPRPKKARPTRLKFTAARGAPISDKEAAIAGRELLKIAEQFQVEGIRSVDAELVWSLIEADPHHPMRKLRVYETINDIASAARKHWIAQTDIVIRSVRTIRVVIHNIERPPTTCVRPLFAPPCSVQANRGGDVRTRNVRVIYDDMLENDPVYVASLAGIIRRIRTAIGSFEQITAARKPSEAVAQLRDDLRAALDEYMSGFAAAAE